MTVKKEGSTWYYRIYIGTDPLTHKKQYKKKRGFKTQKEAKVAEAKVIASIDRGTYVDNDTMTVSEFMEYFKAQYVKKNCAPTTARRYNFSINDINEYLGNIKLIKLTPLQVQQFYDDVVEDKEQSQSTLLKTHRTFHLAIQCALKWRLVNVNVCDLVIKPKPIKANIEFWKSELVDTYLNALKDKWFYPISLLAIQTGMREGELCALKWHNIHLDNAILNVCESRKRNEKNVLVDGPTKNKRNRTITLFPATVEWLRKIKPKKSNVINFDKSNNIGNYVFTYDDGRPIDPHTLCQKFSEIIKSNETIKEKITFHGLRHTHATMLLAAGVNIKVISERLGHSTIAITMDTYVHVDQDLQRKEMEKASNLF